MALTGTNTEQKIWNYLFENIKNNYGTAGLMGNLYAESGLSSIAMENAYKAKIGLNDETYTKSVDNGTYTNFVKDSVGYGLAQWTFWSLKQDLLNYAKKKGTSIGDLEMQLEFLILKLKQEYPKVWNILTKATSVLQASNVVLLDFERPYNQSEQVQKNRANYGQTYYDRYYNHIVQNFTSQEATALIEELKQSKYATYLLSTGTHYISNSGSDERGSYIGGAAGDQTGNEWTMRSWYNRPWDCVLRHPNYKVGIRLAELSCAAALNNHIGYDQGQRDTYWQQLQKVGYDPSKITVNCESDCSAGVIANTKAVGYLMNISKLKDLSATYTGNMKQAYLNAGFEVLTGKYISSGAYLLPGDILLNEIHHTACNVTLGSASRSNSSSTIIITPSNTSTSSNSIFLKKGSKGSDVKHVQEMLIACGYDCGSYGADGDFGRDTEAAVRKFQTDAFILVDGIVGSETMTKLEAAYKEASNKNNAFKNFKVKVTVDSLNIRLEPNTTSSINGWILDKGIYTIVDKSGTWGKLKSGLGWISLNYTQRVSDTAEDTGKEEELLSDGSHDYNNTPSSTSYKKYSLTDKQIKGIANIAYRENGEEAVSDEVSLMANLFELQTKYKTVYDYVRNSGWFGKAANDMDNGSCPASAIQKTKDVLINGKRTLPLWINEHDCFSDITSATNNGKSFTVSDRSKYKKDTTIIKNVYGATYTFYKFPSSVADPFGYTAAAYNKYNKNNTSSSSSTEWKAIGTAVSTVNDLNYRKTPNGTILGKLNIGNRFEVDGQKQGQWIRAKVKDTICWIFEDYIKYD